MTEREKVNYIAGMHCGDIFPDAFRYDNELTLICMLARRILELERRLDEQSRA